MTGGDVQVTSRGESQSSHPSSPCQERFWLLDQLDPDHAGDKVNATLRLRGSLDVASLARALQAIVDRHEVLRTTFDAGPEGVRQIVHPTHALGLETHDLEGLDPTEREAEVRRRILTSTRVRLDLRRGPLVQATLLRLAPEDHVLMVVGHHGILDAVSRDVLYRDLLAVYAAFRRGLENPLPPLAAQYGDYARWCRERMRGAELEAQLAYWLERLRDLPPRLELPTDSPRTDAARRRGATVDFTIDGPLLQRLQQLRSEARVSVTDVLLAAMKLLLHRYTGQTDIAAAMLTGGARPAEFEPLVGAFVNTVVLRTDLSDNPPFRELLGRFHRTARDAYRRSDIPFESVLGGMEPTRRPAPGTFPEVLFTVIDVSRLEMSLPELDVQRIDVSPQAPHLELSFVVWKRPQSLDATLLYDRGLFESSRIERMQRHYLHVLVQVVNDPDVRLSDVEVIDDEERRELRRLGAGPVVDHPTDRYVHELVAEQVRRSPDAIAARIGNECLTYGELDARSSDLAQRLRLLGVGPEVIVALYLERSLEMVVAMLGVLKAGGAYLPLDTAEPSSRLEFKLRDSGAAVAVSSRALRDGLPVPGAMPVVCLDGQPEPDAGDGEVPVEARATPDSLAYVIYTSGSTGVPKGVLVCHRSLVNQLSWMQRQFQPEASDRFLQWTSYTFDASVWDFLLPLTVGASIVLVAPGCHADAAYLVETIRDRSITILHAVPSLLPVLLDHPGFSACRTIRQVFVGAESVPPSLVARLFQTLDAQVHNLYGPTEATIDTTYHTFTRDEHGAIAPIGRPIDNVVLRVVDERGALVPFGQRGELWIGGAGLARGYLNRPDLEAERFVHGLPGAGRFYKSGDLVRYAASGSLEFLGRTDDQVKLRGFRIELGEIEAVLSDHPWVHQAAVAMREDAVQERRLAAYVVLDPQRDEEPGEPWQSMLERWSSDRLPSYMVPSAFVLLERLPRTSSGKIDRNALPVPDRGKPSGHGSIAPRTATERIVAGIWKEVLRLDGLGVDEDFFRVGGHSLLATQVLSRIERELEVRVPLSRFFRVPTVASMADYVDRTVRARGMSTTESSPRETGEI